MRNEAKSRRRGSKVSTGNLLDACVTNDLANKEEVTL